MLLAILQHKIKWAQYLRQNGMLSSDHFRVDGGVGGWGGAVRTLPCFTPLFSLAKFLAGDEGSQPRTKSVCVCVRVVYCSVVYVRVCAVI